MIEEGYYIVHIYKINSEEKPVKSLAFATEGLARTYVEGFLQAQAMLGLNKLHCEIIFQRY